MADSEEKTVTDEVAAEEGLNAAEAQEPQEADVAVDSNNNQDEAGAGQEQQEAVAPETREADTEQAVAQDDGGNATEQGAVETSEEPPPSNQVEENGVSQEVPTNEEAVNGESQAAANGETQEPANEKADNKDTQAAANQEEENGANQEEAQNGVTQETAANQEAEEVSQQQATNDGTEKEVGQEEPTTQGVETGDQQTSIQQGENVISQEAQQPDTQQEAQVEVQVNATADEDDQPAEEGERVPEPSSYSGKYSPAADEQAQAVQEGTQDQQEDKVQVEVEQQEGGERQDTEADVQEMDLPQGEAELGATGEDVEEVDEETSGIPEAPPHPTEVEDGSLKPSAMAMQLQWSFGLNKAVPVLNLTDEHRDMIAYSCSHTGILYDYKNNEQFLLQGHSNNISCMCVSRDKRWLATADIGENNLIIVWDTYNGTPVRTIFDPCPESGIKAMALTPDAKYLATLTSSETQMLSIWDWTTGSETPLCTADLQPSYGKQNFLYFNPDDNSQLMSSSDIQCIFYSWNMDTHDLKFFAPPLNDQDFNRQVGKFTQSVYLKNSTRVLTATTQGNLVVWDNNKPLSKLSQDQKPTPDKKAVKLVKQQDKAIIVLVMSEEDYIVTGDSAGHIRFYDQKMKLLSWYQDFKLGPINAISFAYLPDFYRSLGKVEKTDFPPDATIQAKKFVLRRFIIGTTTAIYASVLTDGTDVKIIHRDHDASIYAIDTHPTKSHLAVGSYSGLLKLWDYDTKTVINSRSFDRKEMIRVLSFTPKGGIMAVGFTNGLIRFLDSMTLDDIQTPFREARDAIINMAFSHDEAFFAATDAQFTTSLFAVKHVASKLEDDEEVIYQQYYLLGRYRAHYKQVVDMSFGILLDSDQPRLLTLGEDRQLVEYDLQKSLEENHVVVMSSERIEQSAIPMCMTWYPPLSKEHFILTANNHYKIKLYNTTTKMCRKTVLGPIYGSPIQKIIVLPTKDPHSDVRFLAYITVDKAGLIQLPADGNPFNAMALFSHPQGVTNMVCSHDGKYIFTAGAPTSVHMWKVNKPSLQAQSQIGGQGVQPFYTLIEGGEDGELQKELEDYFYYSQLRSQGLNTMDKRQVSSKIPVTEVPFIMRALGYYPSEQEIQEMLNEIKFSDYVETGEYKTEIGLDDFIKLYVNHRPAFGLRPEELLTAFHILGDCREPLPQIDRGELLDLLQNRGEPMTENELAECLTTLMGFNEEGGAAEEHEFDPSNVGEMIHEFLPLKINADSFANKLLGLGLNSEVLESESQKMLNKTSNTNISNATPKSTTPRKP